MYKLGFVILAQILLLSVVFAATPDYDACLAMGNSQADCSNFIQNAKDISHILGLSYTKSQDLNSFVSCIDAEKQKSNFDYRVIKNICSSSQSDKAQSSFRSRCFYTLDSNNSMLNVKCKGVFPSQDYVWDLVLQTDVNKTLLIEPKIILTPDFAITGTNLSLFNKDINLLESGIVLSDKISMLPLAVELTDTTNPLKSLFQVQANNSVVDPLSRSYLDCITIHILMSDSKGGKYLLKKSGYSFLQDSSEIFTSCKDLVTYAFAIDLTKYDEKKTMFLDMLDVLINNYLNDSNFSVESMTSYLDNVSTEYAKFSEFESQINKNKDVPLKLSLDSDYFLIRLQNATKGLSEEERKTILSSAGPTLLKNKEDLLSVRRKTTLAGILDFFTTDQVNIVDKDLKQIYSDIEYSLLKTHFDNSNIVDLTDVSAKISGHSIALGQFNFEFVKPLQFDYLGDKNYQIVITQLNDGLSLQLPDYNVTSVLSLGLENNSVLVGQKEATFLKADTLKNISSGNVTISAVELIMDVDTPVFVVHQEIIGKLLGIIKIKELVKSEYFATNGVLSKISKPWWDFLVVYN